MILTLSSFSDVTHTIDLRHEKNMNVTIYSKTPHAGYHLMNEPFCLICRGVKNCLSNITLSSGDTYSITFLCKNMENLRIIAEQSVGMYSVYLLEGKRRPLTVYLHLKRLLCGFFAILNRNK